MSKLLETKANDGSSDDDFDVYFPRFILALRDFSLDLHDDDEHEITPDQYFENCLSLKSGDGEEIAKTNKPKYFLRKYFKNRKCFTFDRPGKPKIMKKMDQLEDADLDDDFVQSTQMFMQYVHTECEPLSLINGKPVNGRMFASRVKYYVGAIREGAMPSIEGALKSTANIENEKAVKDTTQTYITQMNVKLSIPTPDEKTFLDVHIHCKEKAFEVFQTQSMMDEGNKYKTKADTLISKEQSNFVQRNHEESQKRCKTALMDLHTEIEKKLRLGKYSVSGGYKIYEADRETLKTKYNAITNLGVKKSKMYLKFTYDFKNEEDSVLFADNLMTQRNKEAEKERKNKEESDENFRISEKEIKDQRIINERMEKQHQEELEKIKEQREREIKIAKKKLDAVNDQREKERRRQKEEGVFDKIGNFFKAVGTWILDLILG